MNRCLFLAGLTILMGCFSSLRRAGDREPSVDAGSPDGAIRDTRCLGDSSLACYFTCLERVPSPPICADGAWVCPPGAFEDSECRGPCPEVFAMCTREGATCQAAGGGECEPDLSCRCSGGSWDCEAGPLDPICTCDGTIGETCADEGASCGTCCPGPGERGRVECAGGVWRSGGCLGVPCPPITDCEFLLENEPVGRSCVFEPACSRVIEGIPCCTRYLQCVDGRLEEGTACDDDCDQRCERVTRESDCEPYGCVWDEDLGCRSDTPG